MPSKRTAPDSDAIDLAHSHFSYRFHNRYMISLFTRLLLLLVISIPAHTAELPLTKEDRVEISKLIIEKNIAIRDRHGKPVIRAIMVTLVVDGRREPFIESALSKKLPIRFIPKERQAKKDHCWIDSQTGKPVMGMDSIERVPKHDHVAAYRA